MIKLFYSIIDIRPDNDLVIYKEETFPNQQRNLPTLTYALFCRTLHYTIHENMYVQYDAVECSSLITCIVSIGDNTTMDKNNYFPEEMEKYYKSNNCNYRCLHAFNINKTIRSLNKLIKNVLKEN